jgi:DNA invertase Pin-like site-specific DNA recombinase
MAETKCQHAANYRKPPLHTRFKKSQSGNPRGRPKKNLPALLVAALNDPVYVTTNGRRRKITKREAVIAQLVNESAGANLAPAVQRTNVWRTAISWVKYAGVSTGDQDAAGQTMRLQDVGAIKVFTDVRSGKSMDRPGLTELLAYARKGDIMAVVRLDRPGQSPAELISIVEHLKARGVALLSLEEKIDTSSAAGELIFHVFGAIAHFERRLIAERTKDGIAAARARRKRPGRQPVDADKVQAALRLVERDCHPLRRPASSDSGDPRFTVRSLPRACVGA